MSEYIIVTKEKKDLKIKSKDFAEAMEDLERFSLRKCSHQNEKIICAISRWGASNAHFKTIKGAQKFLEKYIKMSNTPEYLNKHTTYYSNVFPELRDINNWELFDLDSLPANVILPGMTKIFSLKED